MRISDWSSDVCSSDLQVGDGEALARMTGITVVNDLRSADVAAGGQGAPLLPIYHRALAEPLEKPVAILNLCGVANIPYIVEDSDLTAFDTGLENGRALCRGRVCQSVQRSVGAVAIKKKTK